METQESEARQPSLVEVALAETHASIGTTLFELSESYLVILEQMDLIAAAGDGEIPEDLYDVIDEIEQSLEAKFENYIKLYKNLKLRQAQHEAVAAGLKASIQPIVDEIARYEAQGRQHDTELERIRDRMGDQLETLARQDPAKWRKKVTKKERDAGKTLGNPYFKCEAGSTWTQDNPPGVQLLVEPAEVPVGFLHAPREEWVDKGSLKEILADPEHAEYEKAAEIASIDQTRGGRVR